MAKTRGWLACSMVVLATTACTQTSSTARDGAPSDLTASVDLARRDSDTQRDASTTTDDASTTTDDASTTTDDASTTAADDLVAPEVDAAGVPADMTTTTTVDAASPDDLLTVDLAPQPCSSPSECPSTGLGMCRVATCIDGKCGVGGAANGVACDDNNACTSGETCQAGVCGAPTSTVTCGDPDQCTLGHCVPATGACESLPRTCPAPDDCHKDGTCDLAMGCQYANADDGKACNKLCQVGVCASGTCTNTQSLPVEQSTSDCTRLAQTPSDFCDLGNAIPSFGISNDYWPSCRPSTAITDDSRTEAAVGILMPPHTRWVIDEIWSVGFAIAMVRNLFSSFVDLKLYADDNGLPGDNLAWLRSYGGAADFTIADGGDSFCQPITPLEYVFNMQLVTPFVLDNPDDTPRRIWIGATGASGPRSVANIVCSPSATPNPTALYCSRSFLEDLACSEACQISTYCSSPNKVDPCYGIPQNTWVPLSTYLPPEGSNCTQHYLLRGRATPVP